MKKIAVIGGVVIVAAVVISPYYAGKGIESRFEQKVAALNSKVDKYFHVKDFVKLEYHAGWFSSTAKTIIGNKLVINHSITHGPYCFFGLGRIESSFEIPEKSTQQYEQVKTFFNGQDPYTMTTEVSYGGATYFNLHSPAIGEKTLPESASSKITWQGLDLYAKFTKSEVNSSFEMPKFGLSEEGKLAFSVEGVKSKGKSDRFFDNQLNLTMPANFNLNSTGGIDKITFATLDKYAPVNIELNKITGQTNSKNNAFTSNFNVDKITAAMKEGNLSIDGVKGEGSGTDALWILRKDLIKANWASKTIVDINNIKVNAPSEGINIALNYHQEQEFLDDGNNKVGYRELYKATAIDAQVPSYSNFVKEAEFGYKIAGLPKEQTAVVLGDYIDYLKSSFMMGLTGGRSSYAQVRQYEKKLMQSGQTWAIASLQGTPSLEAHLKLQGYQGAANVNFNASLVKPDMAKDPQQLIMGALPRVNAKLAMQTPKAIVADFFSLANVSEEKLAQFEQQVAEQYPFVIKGNDYNVEIELKDGQIYVNGQLDQEFTQKILSSFR